MKLILAGKGKLASGILSHDWPAANIQIQSWEDFLASSPASMTNERLVLVHAGSGRQLEELADFSRQHQVPLLELATGSALEQQEVDFPLAICPNTSLMMLRFLLFLRLGGKALGGLKISLEESHQEAKKTVAGTALAMSRELNIPDSELVSYRDPKKQTELGIPSEFLGKHAWHRIRILDEDEEILITTKVLGAAPYARGLETLVKKLLEKGLKRGNHTILDLIQDGLLD